MAATPLEVVLTKLPDAKRSGGEWMAVCPAHADNRPSLAIREGADGRALLHCHAGCTVDAVLAALDLTARDLFADDKDGVQRAGLISTYDYVDKGGQLLFQVCRFLPKAFRQRRPDDKGGWIWRLDGTKRVLYRLPEVVAAVKAGRRIFVVEGEKDVEAARRAGVVATCNPGGAGKWRPEYSEPLRGADVVIVADRDEPGRKHAAAVATALRGVATRTVVVESAVGKDVSDHLTAGKTLAQLCPLALEQSAGSDPPTDDADPRPTILIRPELTAMTDEAIAAIAERPDLGVYVRGRMLVTVARDGSCQPRWLRRHSPGTPMIVEVMPPRMLGLLDEAIEWQKWNKRTEANERAMPPERVAAQVLGRLEWPLPYLEGVIEAPTLRADGSLLVAPGWDDATGLLYEPKAGVDWPPIPEQPTTTQVREAVGALLDPVLDFPFVAETDRSAYVAAVLTLVARHMIDGPVPLFAIRAPTPGTGKTLLGDVIGLGGTGRIPPAMSMSYEAEELRKRITAIAMSGTAVVLLDNLSGSLGSDVLAAALTKCEWEDRLLGHTEMVRLPLRTVWLATGNNLAFHRTLARRVIPIDLDAKLEAPEDRSGFRYTDLLDHVRRMGARLIVAALTVLRGFHVARRPTHGGARMGSFEAWDDLVRSAVIWAGLEDPAGAGDPSAGRGRVRAQGDDDTETLAILLTALRRAFPDEAPFTAAQVMQRAEKDDALHRDLDVAAPAKGGKVTVRSLGYALRGATGRPCEGLTLHALAGKRPRTYTVIAAGTDTMGRSGRYSPAAPSDFADVESVSGRPEPSSGHRPSSQEEGRPGTPTASVTGVASTTGRTPAPDPVRGTEPRATDLETLVHELDLERDDRPPEAGVQADLGRSVSNDFQCALGHDEYYVNDAGHKVCQICHPDPRPRAAG